MGRQDHKIEKLVIPPHTAFTVLDGGVSVEFEGDVVLSGPLPHRLARVLSHEGSITLHGPLEIGEVVSRSGAIVVDGAVRGLRFVAQGGPVTLSGDIEVEEVRSPAGSVSLHGAINCGTVHAAEELIVEGDVTARLLQGGFVRINSGSVNARGIEGTARVDLGGAKLAVEVVIAPDVQVSPASAGRVNVVESVNELAPNGLKGGFRMHEYAELTGVDPARFLEERGVRPLSALSSPSVVVRGAPLGPADDRTLSGDLEEVDEELSELDLEPVDAAAPASAPPKVEVAQPTVDPRVREDLAGIATRIRAAYPEGSAPEPIGVVLALLDAADVPGLKEALTGQWNLLVPWYQQRGKLIPYAVISSFNAINSMLKKL